MTNNSISFEDFSKIDLRIGTIISAKEFSKAIKPSYQLEIDFGQLGTKNSSAQITTLYSTDDLIGKQVIAVVNFQPKQIANFISECLVLGIQDGEEVVLLQGQEKVPNGQKVS